MSIREKEFDQLVYFNKYPKKKLLIIIDKNTNESRCFTWPAMGRRRKGKNS
jgi:hypothetical protein